MEHSYENNKRNTRNGSFARTEDAARDLLGVTACDLPMSLTVGPDLLPHAHRYGPKTVRALNH